MTPAAPEAVRAQPLSGSFQTNMRLPVHRWFRYSAGFSADWVEHEVHAHGNGRLPRVYDPFAGSGTTLIAAQRVGADAVGVESHPLVSRVAAAKLDWNGGIEAFARRADRVLGEARPVDPPEPVPALLAKIFEPEALRLLYGLRAAVEATSEGDDVDALMWLALVSILRLCSPAGTAQWQYVLPNKTKARVAEPREALRAQVALMLEDMRFMQGHRHTGDARLVVGDARETEAVPEGWADLVVTSPPYPNNFDYADATRIEMTFLGEIAGWGDLQGVVRRHLIRSCSQHMARYDARPDLASEAVAPIRDELAQAYDELEAVRLHKGGRKAYHRMVAAYFADLAACWVQLRRAVRDGGEVVFVVGDSAPYGVHIPVERWLGELALAAGFEAYSFEKLRDRNTSRLWKSRRHDVQLHEGILRVR